MAPSDTPQGPVTSVCDHSYETRMKCGDPIAVRLCTLCHTPDWDDLAAQASKVYQRGWEASAQLHRDGWLRDQAQPPTTPIPEDTELDDEHQLTRRLKLAHQQRRAKEAQLDGIRRALIDTNVIQEDDPYSHADLEDVIRQTVPEIERQAVGWEQKYFQMIEKRTPASAAEIEQLRNDLDEARSWARHGYEIGQRHCGWTDHGVAPDWLTEGWPHAFDSCEHLKRASKLDTELAEVRSRSLGPVRCRNDERPTRDG